MLRITSLLIIFSMCQFSFAQGNSFQERIILAKSVWSPLFDEIDPQDIVKKYDEYRATRNPTAPSIKMTNEYFNAVKEVAYETFAEVLNEQDLLLQKRMYNTAVGSKVLSNMPIMISGLPPEPITLDQFTPEELAEWEHFSTVENEEIQVIAFKMRDFSKVLMGKKERLAKVLESTSKN